MKKIILASVLAAGAIASISSANAASTTICTGVSPAASGAAPGTTTSDFVKNAFTPKCSANVHMAADSAQTYMRVGSGSAKGGRSFIGSTAGGSVQSSALCATGCVASDATTACMSTNNPTSG
ncbi:MAG: hypothetical protein FD157_97 [Rhodocyclaceae bacterium]|nr:MAG: hypothetical protein FD157_97 [Rhodocyclaceae bacterium]TND04915.1 MAG: hypothetical protein FD118_734 [Rhodocyclaceae bacterium]